MKSLRLQTISQYFEEGDKLADVGCDHGYLGILALRQGVSIIQLIDNKQGPLNSAVRNLEAVNEKKAEVIYTLADGLEKIDKRINKIALCGMGGYLIIKIISNHLDLAKTFESIIIQANSNNLELRQFLNKNNFKITDEEIIYEKSKYYEIIITHHQANNDHLTHQDLYFGPILRQKRSHNFVNKYLKHLKKLEKILINYDEPTIKEEIAMIREELNDAS